MSTTVQRLLLVYNADSGKLNALIDSAKKLLLVNGCPLCSLTHSLAGERSEWQSCKESLGVPFDYVHRDEVTPALREVVGEQLPAVVADTGERLVLLFGPDVIQRCRGNVADLRGRIELYVAMRKLEIPAAAAAV